MASGWHCLGWCWMAKLFDIAGLAVRAARLAAAALFLVLVTGIACLSGGGNPIVYVYNSDGNGEIYVVDPQTGESSRLTSNSAPDEGPRWSPDGQSIAYVSRDSGDKEIHVIDREGIEDRRLTRNPGLDGSPRWSPERQMLAYVSEAQEAGDSGSDLFAISLESLEVDQVTFEAPTEELGDWSPDGEWLIFYNVGPEEERGLWLRNPTGVNLLRLTEGHDSQPSWSPNGKYISFVRQEENVRVIYVAQPADGDSWGGGVEETPLTNGDFDEYSPVWHPNSKTLAFVSTRDGNPEIYTMQADGDDLQRLTNNNAEEASPVWSPDGKRLAFVTRLYGSADIFVMNADGTEQRRLTKNDGDDISPDW